MKNLFKRGLSVMLALIMCVSMLNLTAFAAHTHTPTHTMGSNGVGWTVCTCGQQFQCTNHSDEYCQWHGGYNDKQHTGGDGSCDYCHASVGNPNCPGPGSTACDHIGTGRREETVREATCMLPKLVDRYCLTCDEKVAQNEVEGAALGHVWTTTDWTHDDSANCTHAQAGTHSVECARPGCDGNKTSEAQGKKEANHTYDTGVRQADGATKYTCTACGHWYEDACSHTKGTGGDAHKFDHQETMGDCVTSGTAIFMCIYCGHEETRNTGIVADAHNYVKTNSSTIRQDGANGHYWVCTRDANHTHTDTEAHRYSAWNWVYTDWVDDTDDARIQHREATGTRTCNDCGYSDTTNVKHTDTDKKGLTEDDLTRQKGEKTFTVAYLVKNGGTSTAPLDQTTVHLMDDDPAKQVEIKAFDGYTFDSVDRDAISYSDNEQLVVHVYYTRNSYDLTINYVDMEGNEVAASHTARLDFEAGYDVTSPVITGYLLADVNQATVSGNMPSKDVEINVQYVKLDQRVVRWVNWNGTVLETGSFYENEEAPEASAYSNAAPTRPSDGTYNYTFSRWSAPAVDADGNVTYTAQFSATFVPTPPVSSNPVEIEEPETPLGPEPSEPVEIDEPETPLGPLPELPEEPEEPEEPIEVDEPETPLNPLPELPGEVEIDEPETPLAAVPQTGDNTVLWATTAVASGAGLIWLAVDGKKRREDAE